jgi:transposase
MAGEQTTPDCPGCRRLGRENAHLKARLAEVERQLAEVQRRLDAQQRAERRQATPFRRRHHKAKPKKSGRTEGHAVAQRARPEHVDQVVEVPLEVCPTCQTPLEDKAVQEQFQIDMPPIEPQVIQFNIHSGYCPRCKKRVQGRDPRQTSTAVGAAGTQIGPGLLSMGAELKHRLGVPYRKICDFFATYLGVELCPATLVRAEQRLVALALPSYQLLIEALRRCHVVHADETGWRIERVNAWLWVFSSQTVTVYVIETSRGHEVPEAILGPEFAGVLVVDGLESDDVLAYQKGQCVGHVLRRTGQLAETLTGLDQYYVKELQELLQEAVDLAKRRERLTERGYGRRVQQVEERLDLWLTWHGAEPEQAVQRLARHVAAHREEWLRFLYDPAVPATNNHAERMLRPAVICRKIGGCNKSLLGALVHGVLASLAVSCQQQGKRFMDLATSLFRSPVPQAIPLDRLPDG